MIIFGHYKMSILCGFCRHCEMYMVSKFIRCFQGKKVHHVQEHKGGPHNLNNDIQVGWEANLKLPRLSNIQAPPSLCVLKEAQLGHWRMQPWGSILGTQSPILEQVICFCAAASMVPVTSHNLLLLTWTEKHIGHPEREEGGASSGTTQTKICCSND